MIKYNHFIIVLFGLLALIPLLALCAPRALSFAPSLMGFIAYLSLYWQNRKWPEINKTYILFIGPLIALAILSAFWSHDFSFSLERSFKISLILLPAILLFSALQHPFTIENAAQSFFRIFLASYFISGLCLCIELYAHMPLYELLHAEKAQNGANLSPTNRSVVFFVLCSFLAFGAIELAVLKSRLKLIIKFSIGLILALILFKTESQTAHVAFGLGCIGFLIPSIKHRKVMIGLCAIITCLLLTTPLITNYMHDILSPMIADHDIAWLKSNYALNRIEIWATLIDYALQKPLLGHGIEITRTLNIFENSMYHQEMSVLHPHNFAVQLWLEFGILGAIFGSYFLGFLLYQMHKTSLLQQSKIIPSILTASFVAALTAASTSYGLWQSWWLGSFVYIAALNFLFVQVNQAKISQNMS